MTRNAEEKEILHEIFRLVSRFPNYISCYIAENRLPLGQCVLNRAKLAYLTSLTLFTKLNHHC